MPNQSAAIDNAILANGNRRTSCSEIKKDAAGADDVFFGNAGVGVNDRLGLAAEGSKPFKFFAANAVVTNADDESERRTQRPDFSYWQNWNSHESLGGG